MEESLRQISEKRRLQIAITIIKNICKDVDRPITKVILGVINEWLD